MAQRFIDKDDGGAIVAGDIVPGSRETAPLSGVWNDKRFDIKTAIMDPLAGAGRTTETIKQNADDVIDLAGVGRVAETVKDNADDIGNHVGNDGSDHSFIDQDVKQTATPRFNGVQLYNGSSNVDKNIEFASDADMLWDESLNRFVLNKALAVPPQTTITSGVSMVLVESGNDDVIRHITPANLAAELGGGGAVVLEVRTSDPASPATGEIWLRSDL